MQITRLDVGDVLLIELEVHGDERGLFVERFQTERFREHGLPTAFVQDNHSRSAPGVLRGLHFQRRPPQGKLVGVTARPDLGRRRGHPPGSPTFGRVRRRGTERHERPAAWIPAGFAHGFCVLGDEPADVLYKVDALYNPRGEAGIAWDDPELAVAWPIREPILSARDRALPSFAAYRANPVAWRVAEVSPLA